MNDVLTNALIDWIARWVLGIVATQPKLTLHLFVNAWTFSPETVAANLTECTAAGYAAFPFSPSSWSGSTVAGVASYAYPPIPFTFATNPSQSQTIYGHWVSDSVTGAVLWGMTWQIPYVIPVAASEIYLIPTWGDKSC